MIKYIFLYGAVVLVVSLIIMFAARYQNKRQSCKTCSNLKMKIDNKWYCDKLPGGYKYNPPKYCGYYKRREPTQGEEHKHGGRFYCAVSIRGSHIFHFAL